MHFFPTIGPVFFNNSARKNGGLIYTEGFDSSIRFNNSFVEASTAMSENGGAIYGGNKTTFSALDTQFINNTANLSGGAIYLESVLDHGLNFIEGSLFQGSDAQCGSGGAIWLGGSFNGNPIKLLKVVAKNNEAPEKNGGVIFVQNASLILTNWTASFNEVGLDGGIIYSDGTVNLVDNFTSTSNSALNATDIFAKCVFGTNAMYNFDSTFPPKCNILVNTYVPAGVTINNVNTMLEICSMMNSSMCPMH